MQVDNIETPENEISEIGASTEAQMLAIYEKMNNTEKEPKNALQQEEEGREAEEVEETAEEVEEENEASEEVKAVSIEPPHTWTKEQKEAFAAVPDEHKQLLKEHYDEMNRGFQAKMRTAAEAVKFDKQFKQIFDDNVQESLKRQGYTPISYVNQLVSEVNKLTANPVDGIKSLMKQLNVGAKELGLTSYEEDYDDFDDGESERVKKLEAELAELKRVQQYDQTVKRTQQAIELFFSEEDENGQPAHPYLEDKEVQRDVLAYVQRERQLGSKLTDYELLTEAYENSPTAKRLREQASTVKSTDELEERRKKVAQKKRAGVSVSSSVAHGTGKKPPAPKNTFEAMLRIAQEKGQI